jgi:translation initiation factor 4G
VWLQIGLEKAFDAVSEKDSLALVDLLSALAARGVLSGSDLKEGTAALLEALEDFALDIPAAPRLLGRLLGAAAAGGLLDLAWVAGAVAACESAEPRRGFLAAALKAAAEAAGDERLVALVKGAGLDLPKLLASEDEFDGPLPAPADFLREQGLGVLA